MQEPGQGRLEAGGIQYGGAVANQLKIVQVAKAAESGLAQQGNPGRRQIEHARRGGVHGHGVGAGQDEAHGFGAAVGRPLAFHGHHRIHHRQVRPEHAEKLGQKLAHSHRRGKMAVKIGLGLAGHQAVLILDGTGEDGQNVRFEFGHGDQHVHVVQPDGGRQVEPGAGTGAQGTVERFQFGTGGGGNGGHAGLLP